jgi:glycosyltransferase involved in cell wall biosynthesis
MLVSIIMPVYNRETFLNLAIISALSQTYKDIELVIIDDGSTDSSRDIIRKFSNSYPRRIVPLFQEHLGPTVARNNGIKKASGGFIAFLDSDDLLMPGKISRQIDIYSSCPSFSFIYTGYNLIDTNGKEFQRIYPDRYFSGNIYKKLWIKDNFISGGTIMVKKNNLHDVGLFDESLTGAENLDLRIKLSKIGPVGFVNDILYSYRRHDSNLSSNTTSMTANYLNMVANHFGVDGIKNRSLWKSVMSVYFSKEGNRYFALNNYIEAKKHLLLSLKYNLFNRHALLIYFRCFMGYSLNTRLSSLKKRLF